MKKIFLILMLCNQISANQLQSEWRTMQNIYRNLKKIPLDQSLVLPAWASYASSLSDIIMGNAHEKFLAHDLLYRTMLRAGFSRTGHFELNFIHYFLSEKNKTLLNRYRDTCIGGLELNCRNKQYTANSVGQLYYLAKILESFDSSNINTFVEFGAGYGNLARITTTLLPDISYVIIDLPELIALQYLYLKMSVDNPTIIVHYDATTSFTSKGIHLVPINIVKDIELHTTIFASHFALSEAPDNAQRLIIQKNFFDAKLCYIVGQVNSWGTSNSLNLVHHSLVHNELKNRFGQLTWQPYHHFDGIVANYEAIAHR